MDDFRIQLFTARERRAAAVAIAALLVIVAAAVHELAPARPAAAARPGAAPSTRPTPAPLTVFAYAAESASTVTVAAGNDFSSSVLYRTTDAGRSWHAVKLPAGADHVGAVSLIPGTSDLLLWSGSTAFFGARSTGGRAWRSHDHGAHWSELPMPEPGVTGGPRFLDSAHGYWLAAATGAVLAYSTRDGGRTWQDALDLPATARELGGIPIPANRQVAFSASTAAIGWLVVTARTPDPNGFGPPTGIPQVFRSADGWRTWQPSSLVLPAAVPDGYYLSVAPPQVAPDGRGFVLMLSSRPTGGRPGASFSSGGEVARTTDGGVSWSPPEPTEHLALQLGPAGLLLSAEGPSIAVSHDLGASWTVISSNLPGGGSLVQLSMLTASLGWSVDGRPGEARALLRTLDGGRTWTRVPGPSA